MTRDLNWHEYAAPGKQKKKKDQDKTKEKTTRDTK